MNKMLSKPGKRNSLIYRALVERFSNEVIFELGFGG